MWLRILDGVLRKLLRKGSLELTLADGTRLAYGDGTGTPVRITFHDPNLVRRCVLRPELAVGEAYMDGTLTIEDDDLAGFNAVHLWHLDVHQNQIIGLTVQGFEDLQAIPGGIGAILWPSASGSATPIPAREVPPVLPVPA